MNYFESELPNYTITLMCDYTQSYFTFTKKWPVTNQSMTVYWLDNDIHPVIDSPESCADMYPYDYQY